VSDLVPPVSNAKRSVADLNDALTSQMVWLLERTTIEADPKLLKLRARICVETAAAAGLAVIARETERTIVIREIVSGAYPLSSNRT
jgi:hypothetical protein